MVLVKIFYKKRKNICVFQKKAVPLHADFAELWRNEREYEAYRTT